MAYKKIDIVEAIRLYSEEAWSPSHIGEYMGVTRQAIWKALKKAGVDTSKGGSAFWYNVECTVCGEGLKRVKSRIRNQHYHYCSRDCYYAMLDSGATASPSYYGGRLGQLARWKAAKLYGELPEGAVVHHENSDRADNGADNLVVFRSQGDHMRWHRKIVVEPLYPSPMPETHLAYNKLNGI